MIRSILAQMITSASVAALDALFKQVTAVWAEAHLTDDEASELYAAIQLRRPKGRGHPSLIPPSRPFPPPIGPFSQPRRHQCSPDRAASIFRRRCCASSGAMPPALASRFTESERALLAIIVQEIRKRGHCARPIGALAGLAGISRTSAKRALRIAERMELIEVTRRPRPGQKNLPNIVTIRSQEWQLWIEKGSRSTGGKEASPTNRIPPRKEARSSSRHFVESKPARICPPNRPQTHPEPNRTEWRRR
ncbi:hypothetical protein [Aureimonas sp. AU40]|uniref:hypothetical protein n=1 Tax=Aureimonas sp. AU40 TaxID=1637747 RepID=UPI000B0D3F64|nr:hypothetical protein [Aureimonas sp. AU40]